jgi:hypothetical protein
MLEELQEPFSVKEGEVLTTYACHRIQNTTSGIKVASSLHGAEYQNPLVGTHDHNIPCAVCLAATRETVLMLPGKTTCPTSWTTEYQGYIVSAHDTERPSTFECIDQNQVSVPGSSSNVNGATLFHVEATCNGLQCPPYDPQKELTCAVCTI